MPANANTVEVPVKSTARVMALCCAASCAPAPPVDRTPKQLEVQAPAGETADVELSTLEKSFVVSGTLVADERAALAFQVPGRVADVRVDLGAMVKKGQVLAALDAREMELKVQQAEALLAQAQARQGGKTGVEQSSQVQQMRALLEQAVQNRARTAEMFKQGQVAPVVMEAAQTAEAVAQTNVDAAMEEALNRDATVRQRVAELELARRQVAECRLLAPFDGAVEARLLSPGQMVQPTVPVLTVVRINPVRARLDVPERHASMLRASQQVRLTVDGLPGVHAAVITRLAPVVDPQTRVVVVEAELQNDGSLRPGSLVRATIVAATPDQVPTVPVQAVTAFAGVEKVTVVEGTKTVSRTITTGRNVGERVEVLTGLKPGERVQLKRDTNSKPSNPAAN